MRPALSSGYITLSIRLRRAFYEKMRGKDVLEASISSSKAHGLQPRLAREVAGGFAQFVFAMMRSGSMQRFRDCDALTPNEEPKRHVDLLGARSFSRLRCPILPRRYR